MQYDVVIIGGFGHVGLPLAISLANQGKNVCALDVNRQAAERIVAGKMPFIEEGAEELLRKVLTSGHLKISLDPEVISKSGIVFIVIGTPVDEHLNPEFKAMRSMFDSYMKFFTDGQLIILRSTVYPGTTENLRGWLKEQGKDIELAFCPERIAEGAAIRELKALPQIISSFSDDGVRKCRELFGLLTEEIIVVTPLEAELAKLFNNVWRYIKFATANQFFMIANDQGADFYRIYHAATHKYPRAADLPTAGFAAGACLFKDAMQLAAFNNNTFSLGYAAMLINEGLPNYLVSRLKQRYNLRELVVGVLGMAFKANIDDPRESLSYKLRKILTFECRRVLCSDAYIHADGFVAPEELIAKSDIIVLATAHREYRDLAIPEGKTVVDIWNLWGHGTIV